ncbi:hypothetical protein KDL67_05895 [bacterium]|nr:hypothetical protein [bacterium]
MRPIGALAIAVLLPALVAAGQPRHPSPPGAFPLLFDSEWVELTIVPDSLQVDARYVMRCRGRTERPTPLVFPFPVDSLLGGWRMIEARVAGDPPAPIRWEPMPGASAVRLWVPPCTADTLVLEAVYRQARRTDYARYIVTTVGGWGRPLNYAGFGIRLPQGARPLEFSFPFLPDSACAGRYVYEACEFWPQHDVTVRWRP